MVWALARPQDRLLQPCHCYAESLWINCTMPRTTLCTNRHARVAARRRLFLGTHVGPVCHPANGLSVTGDGVGARMTVEQLRTVVASLRTAVEFSRALAGAMPVLSQLLASSTLTDVQVTLLCVSLLLLTWYEPLNVPLMCLCALMSTVIV